MNKKEVGSLTEKVQSPSSSSTTWESGREGMLLISISASAQTGSIDGGTRGKGLKIQGGKKKRALH
jgi:hypothetical protein